MSGQDTAARKALDHTTGTRPKPRPPAGTGRRANPSPLDCIFILFASVTLLLLLLWIASALAGRDLFSTLPVWLNAIAKNVWAKVTVGSGTIGSFVLRRWLDKSASPNYLVWIGGCIGFLIVALIAVRALIPPPPPPPPPTIARVPIRFSVDGIPQSTKDFAVKYGQPPIKFQALAPEQLDAIGLYEHQNDQYPYHHEVDVPVYGGANSVAEIYFIHTDSRYVAAGNAYDYRICMKANPNRPLPPSGANVSATAPLIRLECSKEQIECRRGPDDLGYVSSCEEGASVGFGMVPVVYAADAKGDLRQAGWVVPSLNTLEHMTDRERVGYTRFEVNFAPKAQAAEAERYYFALQVNEEPVYIDGFLPERRQFPLQKAANNQISFALENLNFTGRYKGFEKLHLSVIFLQGGKEVWRQELEQDYIALRDAPEVRIETTVGTFRWVGRYVVPKNENRYEILVSSTPEVDRAMAVKERFDTSELRFHDRPVAMVVRPPLRIPPFYGLALGIILPSKQVQFTFNANEARDLCGWAVQQVGKGSGGKLIEANLRRYEVATRGYSPCNK